MSLPQHYLDLIILLQDGLYQGGLNSRAQIEKLSKSKDAEILGDGPELSSKYCKQLCNPPGLPAKPLGFSQSRHILELPTLLTNSGVVCSFLIPQRVDCHLGLNCMTHGQNQIHPNK